MQTKNFAQRVAFYTKRFGFKPPIIASSLKEGTTLIVTIPCFKEPDLLPTLNALLACEATNSPVEIIVAINAGSHVAAAHAQNIETLRIIEKWKEEKATQMGNLSFQALLVNDLPPKHAGAGLARKLVMDEALYRFASIEIDGGIVCLDADCTVSPTYLISLEKAFANTNTQSAALYFEHPYQAEADADLKLGIINYELYLRYYIQGLRFAGFPYSLHTVGSSMAVRASTYAATGGMNRRKAGEDFYFMHKIMPQGNAIELNDTCVYPSCRLSDRVPFGTGRAQLEWLKKEDQIFDTYHPQIFRELASFLQQIETWYSLTNLDSVLAQLPKSISQFLEQQNFTAQWQQLKKSTKDFPAFQKRLFHWFDGFKALKYVHFARDHFYDNIPLTEASVLLLDWLDRFPQDTSLEVLLALYRELDRKG